MLKITKFNPKFISDSAKIIVKEFGSVKNIWTQEVAEKYLLDLIKSDDRYHFFIEIDGEFAGAIFCIEFPLFTGTYLDIDTLVVSEKFRNKGCGKLLMKKVYKEAKKNKITGFLLLANSNKNFPMKWYEKIGFEKTGWVQLSAKLSEIKI